MTCCAATAAHGGTGGNRTLALTFAAHFQHCALDMPADKPYDALRFFERIA